MKALRVILGVLKTVVVVAIVAVAAYLLFAGMPETEEGGEPEPQSVEAEA